MTRLVGWLYVIDGASDTVIASIPVGRSPDQLAVNPVTNRIYVTDRYADMVWVIDGATLSVITGIATEHTLADIDVNPATNRIYVVYASAHQLAVIDGVTHTIIATVPMPDWPWGVAVHPGTNKIYVSNTWSYTPSVTVVDGATNTVIDTVPFPAGRSLWSLRIDLLTSLLYIVDHEGKRQRVSIMDTATDTIIGSNLVATSNPNSGSHLAINSNTHRVYVPNLCLFNVSVVYGSDRVDNPSFESVDQSERVRSWRSRGLTPEDGAEEIVCFTGGDLVYEGARSLRLTGAAGVEKEVFQNVAVAGPAGTVINLEGVSRSTDASPAGGRYQIRARVSFTDGSTDTFDVRFAKGTHSWRRGFQAYTAPKAFDRVRVSVVYENQTGTAWFDAVHLWTTGP